MTLSPDRFAAWRSTPERVAIARWENRTYEAARSRLAAAFPAEFRGLRPGRTWNTARTELAHRHPGEFLAILDGIREEDPRPEAATGEAA